MNEWGRWGILPLDWFYMLFSSFRLIVWMLISFDTWTFVTSFSTSQGSDHQRQSLEPQNHDRDQDHQQHPQPESRLPGWCCGCAHRNKAMPERLPVQRLNSSCWLSGKSQSFPKIDPSQQKKHEKNRTRSVQVFQLLDIYMFPMFFSLDYFLESTEAIQLQHGAVHCQGRSVQFISNRPWDRMRRADVPRTLKHQPTKKLRNSLDNYINIYHIFVAN